MSIPPEIRDIIDRVTLELNEAEQEATEGINLVRPILSQFPENIAISQFFAYFSSILFFVEMCRTRRLPTIVEKISNSDVTDLEIQEVGEELGTLLGQVVEAKIGIRRIVERLQN
ncbi:hypothetical protein ACE1CI_23540 [Aerosakkonemataceae cyanobacterium BLCC-F50]|uniref:Restriction endonuclease subunit S n=1 Tax=Floridaenema flaviceps BLCC-F50 TaxID=3153642 RepID=A0ABV4XYB4_9CYAN